MVAIFGVFDSLGGPADGVASMQAVLGDYGAKSAAWGEGAFGLGCRGKPPEDGLADLPLHVDRRAGLVLAADARLDDRNKLGDALGVPRSERTCCTDAELIIRAFVRWGRECPRHLVGDYAFVVWDRAQRTLFCARDHIGVRPFYYALIGDQFVFASAVEAVLAAPGVSDVLDETTVATFLASTTPIDSTCTFFQAVRRLPPGHALTVKAVVVRDGAVRLRIRTERHWRPEQVPLAQPAADDAHAEQFLHLYTQAVRDRLRGSGPVGAHLSGGLDSSSIAVIAARELRRQGRPPPIAYTWLPPPGEAPPKPEHAQEYALVKAICCQEGLRACYGAPTVKDVFDVLRLDGALPGVHVHMNEYVVQRQAAAEGVRVLLSGWGGDECLSFHGRGYWQQLLLTGRWRQLTAEFRGQDRTALGFLAHVLLPLLHLALPRKLRELREGRAHRRWLIDPAFARRAQPAAALQLGHVGVRRVQLQLLWAGHLCARMEGWAASGARRGIEYRYPLLDRRLLEFALGLPPEQFIRGRWGRWLMRHGLRDVLPLEVLWRRIKVDPARSEPFVDAFVETFPMLLQRLAAGRPSRAPYIDLPSLLERLDADRFRAQPQSGVMMRALQFLDF